MRWRRPSRVEVRAAVEENVRVAGPLDLPPDYEPPSAALPHPGGVLKVWQNGQWVPQVVWLSMEDAYRLDSFMSALAHGRVVRTDSIMLDDLTEARSLAGVMRAATRRAEGRR